MRVLNLGAGIQSTTIYLMMVDGDLPTCDLAIFADTQEEPAAVYQHLDRLKSIGGPEIVTVTNGSLGANLIEGIGPRTKKRFVNIPAYMLRDGQQSGIGRRQCTSDFKILPIEHEIRVRVGAVGRPLPKDQTVTQIFGLSFDEPRRVSKVKMRFESRPRWFCEFPLFDEFMTRADCVKYLEHRWTHSVPRSACVFCPYRSDEEWLKLKTTDVDGWNRAVEIDRAIRDKTSVCTRELLSEQYVHKSCVPLDVVEFKPRPKDQQTRIVWSETDCEGMCGV